MSFLQPALLVALPLVALPIIIHLINQRRFQTIRWAAMMFLLAANRMSRGYARLRQWLILLFRMLAIAGLIFAVSRPLSSGWLGLAAGGRADLTIVVLDRSPSMAQQGPGIVESKLATGRQQLAQTLGLLNSARWVLIDSATNQPHEIESPAALTTLPAAMQVSASADLPAMLEAARDTIHTNKAGRTEIWICSDLRENDWNSSSGRWQTLRDLFREFPQGVRFHLLAYPQPPPSNVSVRVTDVRVRKLSDSAELFISLMLTRDVSGTLPSVPDTFSVPIQFEIDGARSEIAVHMTGPQFELRDHRIPLEADRECGWGKVSIPGDANPADNECYFVFDRPAPRQTIIVADDPQAARPLHLAAAISPDAGVTCLAEDVAPELFANVALDAASLVLWQAPLPNGDAAARLEAFVDRGGQVIFFPPHAPSSDTFAGVSWQTWVETRLPKSSETSEVSSVETWRGDQDLLAHTQSGAALPVGELEVRRFCTLSGDHTPLAALKGDVPLLARVTTNRGGVYFCATTPAVGDSSLATDGVVLYVLVQRALAAGAAALGHTRSLVAGEVGGEDAATWQQVAGPPDALSTDFALHAGVYRHDDRLFAINRPVAEDAASVVPDAQVAELFQGLDFVRIDAQAGSLAALIQEIWRLFLVSMMIALVVEAALCLPRIASKSVAPAPAGATS
jgi:hypothetical protein